MTRREQQMADALDYLYQLRVCTAQELAARLGLSVDQARKVLGWLVADGAAWRVKPGWYAAPLTPAREAWRAVFAGGTSAQRAVVELLGFLSAISAERVVAACGCRLKAARRALRLAEEVGLVRVAFEDDGDDPFDEE